MKSILFYRENGTSAASYALIIGLIGVGAIAAISTLGDRTSSVFDIVSETLFGDSGGANPGGDNINDENTPPSISDFENTNITILPNTIWGPTEFTISDPESDAADLTLSAFSFDQNIVADGEITFGGADGTRTISIQPTSGQTGTTTIVISVSDGEDEGAVIFDLTVDDAQYVAVSLNWKAYASSDLTSWTQINLPTSSPYGPSIIWGNDEYVISGFSGPVATSPDGVNWTLRDTGSTKPIYDVLYHDGAYLAGRGASSNIMSRSLDGVNWTNQAITNIGSQINGPVYNGQFYTIVGTSKTAVSNDGISWTAGANSGIGTLVGVAASETEIVAVGQAGVIGTSTDGLTWTGQTSGTSKNLNDVVYGNGIYIAAGHDGTVVRSTDAGVVWSDVSPGGTTDWNRARYVNNLFFLLGEAGAIRSSVDGTSWTTHTSLPSHAYGIAYGNVGGSSGISNAAPTISDVANGTVAPGASYGPQAFTISDTEKDAADLTVTAASSNQAVVADTNIILGGSAENRTVTVVTTAGYSGVVTITLTVSDGDKTDSTSFHVTVSDDIYIQSYFGGRVYKSSDRTNWTQIILPFTSQTLNHIIWSDDDSQFVVVGNGSAVATSPDGDTWTQGSGLSGSMYEVAYGEGMYAAVSSAGSIFTSSDGLTWSQVTLAASLSSTYTLIYDGDSFVAVGGIRTATSSDGVTWNVSATHSAGSPWGVAYSGTVYAASKGSGGIITSDDGGETWTTRSSGVSKNLYGIAYGNGVFVAVGLDGTIISSDDDGVTWTNHTLIGTTNDFNDVEYLNGEFVAVGTGMTYASEDGATWTQIDSEGYYSIAYNGPPPAGVPSGDGSGAQSNDYIISASGGRSFVSDGLNTFVQYDPPDDGSFYYDVIWSDADDLYVMGGVRSNLVTSPDGINWTAQSLACSSCEIRGVVYGAGTYVAVMGTASRAISYSSDAVTWSQTASPLPRRFDVIYAGGKFVSVGDTKSYTSVNGINWTGGSVHGLGILYGVAHGPAGYIAVASNGNIVQSADGLDWALLGSFSEVWNAITYADNLYVAVGDSGAIYTSPDGASWSQRTSGTNNNLEGIDYVNGQFVALGVLMTVLVSNDGVVWENRTNAGSNNHTLTSVAYPESTSGSGQANQAPTISDIEHASVLLNETYGPTEFTIGDVETAASALTVTATSSNQTLVPDGNISLGGSAENRTITVTPLVNQSGAATITVTVDDGTDTTDEIFVLTVAANSPPTISGLADTTVIDGDTWGPADFTIGDNETASSSLTVTAVSSNQTLVADGDITLGGLNDTRNISIGTTNGQTGTVTITLTVDDGTLSIQDSFNLLIAEAYKLTASDGVYKHWLGGLVERGISIDGNLVVAGAPGAYSGNQGGVGAVYAYEYVSGYWQEHKIQPTDPYQRTFFGQSVSVSGNRMVVGSDYYHSSEYGAAFVYELSGSTWTQTAILSPIASTFQDSVFSKSVDIDGDRIIVGAPYDRNQAFLAGAVYVFDKSGSDWVGTKIFASNPAQEDSFGGSVSISGNRIVVGAHNDDDKGSNSGSIYVFDWNGSNWVETKISASDGLAGDGFGTNVDISGDRIIAAAPYSDGAGSSSGSVYILEWNGASWGQTKLTASDAAADNRFGFGVAISGTKAVVSSILGADQGKAYRFEKTGSWNEVEILTAVDGITDNGFGSSVAISNDYLAVGAYKDDDIDADAGAVYVFP